MKITWEFSGGLPAGFGLATTIVSYCAVHDIHLPYLFIGGALLLIAGLGITQGAQRLQRKDREKAEKAEFQNTKRT